MEIKDGTNKMREAVPPLLAWFRKSARELPWRTSRSPYRVWVSEIMLQQTRTAAVIPFYQRFTERLPDVKSLAEVPESDLLKLWEGLGYYSRVRNMKKAAEIVMSEYGGVFPGSAAEIKELPGIGPYTSGAVASIAFGEKIPAVDGNVMRVVTRLLESEEDIAMMRTRRDTGEMLAQAMPADDPGSFNEALMELGACVCVPNGKAECGRCPLSDLCEAHKHHREEELPVKKHAAGRRTEEKTVLIIRSGNRTVIRRRPEKGLLAGMYEFPMMDGKKTRQEVLSEVRRMGLVPLKIKELPQARHIFSHIEWQMSGYLIWLAEPGISFPEQMRFPEEIHENTDLGVTNEEENGMIFTESKEIEGKYPLPAAFRAFAGYMDIRLGEEKYRKGKKKNAAV